MLSRAFAEQPFPERVPENPKVDSKLGKLIESTSGKFIFFLFTQIHVSTVRVVSITHERAVDVLWLRHTNFKL